MKEKIVKFPRRKLRYLLRGLFKKRGTLKHPASPEEYYILPKTGETDMTEIDKAQYWR